MDDTKLRAWCRENDGYLAIYRYQASELLGRSDLPAKVTHYLAGHRVVLAARFDQELAGKLKSAASYDLFMPLELRRWSDQVTFLATWTGAGLGSSTSDAHEVRDALAKGRAEFLESGRKAWEGLGLTIASMAALSVLSNGYKLNEAWFADPDCYAGLKLTWALAAVRFVYGNRKWRDSDFLDLLHCLDLAYADLAVIEVGMADEIRQIQARIPGLGPRRVETIRWLRS